MCEKSRNIYQIARNSKGITQEKAAELLNISIESMRAYESGRTPVPNEVCANMALVYSVDHLPLQHLRENPLGKMVLPEFFEQIECSNAILKLLKEVNDVVKCKDDLIDIGADGVIDAAERERFNNIIKELDELRDAIMNLKYSKQS